MSRRCLRSMHCNTWRFQSPSSCFRRAWLSTAALPRRCLCMCDIHSRVSAYAFGCPLCQHCCCCFVNHLAYCIWLIISMLTDHVDGVACGPLGLSLWSVVYRLSTKFVIGRRRALLVTPSAAPSCTWRQHGSLTLTSWVSGALVFLLRASSGLAMLGSPWNGDCLWVR